MMLKSALLVVILLLPACLSSNSSNNSGNVAKVRNEILKFLNLSDRHHQILDSQKHYDVPSFVKHLYRKKILNRKALLNDQAQSQQDMIRVFFPKARARKTNIIIYDFTFNLSSIRPSDEAIINAELRFHRRRTKAKGLVRLCSLALFSQQLSRNKRKYRNKAPTFIKIKVLPLSGKSLWIRYNVSTVVTEHLKSQREKMIQFKVYVQAYGTSLPSRSWINRHGKNKPFLVVYTRLLKNVKKALNLDPALAANIIEPVQSRSKRGNNNQLCQRRRMFVKFSTLNMKWMIAPTGFSAYKCEGICPEVLTSYYNPTNHAILQNFVHHRYSKSVPQASCVPTTLDSVTMLYKEIGGSLTIREFPDMVVLGCGCR